MKSVKTWLKWIFYYFITSDERLMYQAGVTRGMNCVGMKKGVTSITFYYEPGKPMRDYITRKEFFKLHSQEN